MDMEMTCMDCPSWTVFAIIAALAVAFLLGAIVFARTFRNRSAVLAWTGFFVLLLPAGVFGFAAWRMLFGPSWHGHLLP